MEGNSDGINPEPSFYSGSPDLPVENLVIRIFSSSLQDLITKLKQSGKKGWFYSLPSEAEWEYALRSGGTDFPSLVDDIGIGGPTQNALNGQTNSWGFTNMIGNVWEFTSDWVGDYPNDSVTDPVGPDDGIQKVIRGGSWVDYIEDLYWRAVWKSNINFNQQRSDLGFRLALKKLPHVVELSSTVSLEMIWVEPGTFTMESFGTGEAHEVTLTKGYYLGKYEVTQSQYQAVVNSKPK